jgi:hypothetical protein
MEIADKLTPIPEKDFILLVARCWAKYYNFPPKVDQLACCLSQMVLESGRENRNGVMMWGKSAHNYNWGNIKYSGGEHWQFYPAGEWIKVDGKPQWQMFYPPHIQCKFRAFLTAEDGTMDYIGFLEKRENYREAWNDGVLAGDPVKFSYGLKKGGYYTEPVDNYTRTVVKLFKEFRGKVADVLGSPEALDIYASDFERRAAIIEALTAKQTWEELQAYDGPTNEDVIDRLPPPPALPSEANAVIEYRKGWSIVDFIMFIFKLIMDVMSRPK